MDKKKVVIVGGGLAGATALHELGDSADVTLIDPRDYFEIAWAWLRGIVEPQIANRILIPHKLYLKNAVHIQAKATQATTSSVMTSTGQLVPYDFLVIASGKMVQEPYTLAETKAKLQKLHDKLVRAQTVLIIGGGPVGVELAGEIVTDFPKNNKKVTLVCRGDHLLQFWNAKAGAKAQKWLEKRGVTVILRDSVAVDSSMEDAGPALYTTTKGVQIQADVVFPAMGGGRPDSSWLAPSFPECITEDGRVKVGEDLRLPGHNNIFAIGDITDIKENKQGYLAQGHAKAAAHNIKKLIADPNATDLKKVAPGGPWGIVSLGRKDGLMHVPFATFTGCIPTWLKSKDLFISGAQASIGITAKDLNS